MDITIYLLQDTEGSIGIYIEQEISETEEEIENKSIIFQHITCTLHKKGFYWNSWILDWFNRSWFFFVKLLLKEYLILA